MKRLEVKKYPLYKERIDENYYVINLKRDDDKTLSIFFGGNLDLYFSLKNFNQDPSFMIGKDNYEIYALFDELYHRVITADIFGPITEEEINHIIFTSEMNDEDYHDNLKKEIENRKIIQEKLKQKEAEQLLIQNGVITWKSDEYAEEITPFVQIKRLENAYKLEFGKPIIPQEYQNEADLMLYDPRVITVRFRNSGSRYDPFNVLFMKLYQGLCTLNYDYQQVHMEEYLIAEQIHKGESLRRILTKK